MAKGKLRKGKKDRDDTHFPQIAPSTTDWGKCREESVKWVRGNEGRKERRETTLLKTTKYLWSWNSFQGLFGTHFLHGVVVFLLIVRHEHFERASCVDIPKRHKYAFKCIVRGIYLVDIFNETELNNKGMWEHSNWEKLRKKIGKENGNTDRSKKRWYYCNPLLCVISQSRNNF